MPYLSRTVVLFFTFLPLFLSAGVKQHLKPALGKGDNHTMRNIDFIYMINLDKRPEKFKESAKQLAKYGVVPYRFSAVNGWELSTEVINDVGLKYKRGMVPLMATTYPHEAGGLWSHEFMKEYGRTYFAHCMSRGAIGCALSHISVLYDAWQSGYETVWVMEDDIEVVYNLDILPDLIDELDRLLNKEWDVLFTDQNYRTAVNTYLLASGATKRPDLDCSFEERFSKKFTESIDINDHFRKIAARFGAHSMIIRRSGIKKLLDFFFTRQIYLPYDLENYLMPNIRRYSVTFDVVTNMLGAITDNGFPYYQDKETN